MDFQGEGFLSERAIAAGFFALRILFEELEVGHVVEDKQNEQAYTWEKEDTFVFLMPETDLNVRASFKELPVEVETAAATEPGNETADKMPAADESSEPAQDPVTEDSTTVVADDLDESTGGSETASQETTTSDHEEADAVTEEETDTNAV